MAVARVVLAGMLLLSSGCATVATGIDAELAECTRRIRSPQLRAELSFRNDTAGAVDVYWVDPYDGSQQRYAQIEADASQLQRSYVGHYWLIKTAAGRTIGSHCASEAVSSRPCKTPRIRMVEGLWGLF